MTLKIYIYIYPVYPYTDCIRSLGPIYLVRCYIKWVKTSLTDSTLCRCPRRISRHVRWGRPSRRSLPTSGTLSRKNHFWYPDFVVMWYCAFRHLFSFIGNSSNLMASKTESREAYTHFISFLALFWKLDTREKEIKIRDIVFCEFMTEQRTDWFIEELRSWKVSLFAVSRNTGLEKNMK